MLNEEQYFIIYDQLNNIKTPIKAGGYQVDEGWLIFYRDVEVDRVVMGIPNNGFWFQEVTFQEYSNVLAEENESSTEELESGLDALDGLR